ncbi:MAG TPA: cytochrome c3 family protein [Bacteroidales bacterium]|nr:cytochrome c3 family protein [Bacteroidales bacterium]
MIAAATVSETPHSGTPVDHDSIKKGERLFYNLINTGKGTQACVSCHNVEKSSEFNWNPSAYEIALANQGRKSADLKNILLSPSGKRISEAHKGYALTDAQVGQISVFLQSMVQEGPPKPKKQFMEKLIYIGLILIILLAIADVIYTRYLRFKVLNLIVVLAAGLYVTKITAHEAIALGRSQNYEPDQPIKFSHAVHVKQNKIDCLYCHATAEYSKVAGIPSANVCMNCHSLVREGTRTGRFEINKIHAAIEKQKPIEWVKIHNLPDYTYFDHSQHVSVGKITCQQCHGPVEEMNRVKQVSDLSMGWCVNCHRKTEVQFTNNAFYDKYEQLHKDLKEGKIDRVTAAKVGSTDCMKCHY